MANYDVVKTIVAFLCDDINRTGSEIVVTGDKEPIEIPIFEYSGTSVDYDFSRASLNGYIPSGKVLAISVSDGQESTNITKVFDIRVAGDSYTSWTFYSGYTSVGGLGVPTDGNFAIIKSPGGTPYQIIQGSPHPNKRVYVEPIGPTLETGVVQDFYSWPDLSVYKPKMTNFYLADFSGEYPVEREQPIKLERLQSTELRFCAVYEDGTFEEWTGDVTYTAARGDGAFSIDGNQITIAEDARVPNVTLLARPVYDNLDGDQYATASIDITNPVEPYSPPSGGGGGAGAGGGAGVPSGTGGGGGTFPSDPGPSLVDRIPIGQTGNDIAQSGLFTMYLMNQQYMNLMGEILWEDNVAIQAIKEIFGNPIDSVISTISYPFNLLNLVQYGAQNLYIGPWNTGLPFQALTKSSFQIDWGIISIPFAWGNFLDYSPHTKMELFLPWGPGYVTIDPNDVSPFSNTAGNFDVSTFTAGSIQVKTNVELGKGTCVHNVIGNNGRVIGSYSGIVGKQVPITALDTGGKALTTIAAVSSIVGGVAAGSLAAKGAMDSGRLTGTPMKDPMRLFESASYWDTGMISGRASAQNLINTGHNLASRAINSTPITFPRAGTFSDGSSAMTVQTPFLIISRPVQSVPTQYGHYNGYPSNIHYPNFSNISGYTEISEIHLDNVTATADELQELDSILKGGILL